MPNSPFLLNYLCFGARFLRESRLTTEGFIVVFWLRCVQLPWQRGWFSLFKKNPVVWFFHHLPTTNWYQIPSANTVLIKVWHRRFFVIRRKSFHYLFRIIKNSLSPNSDIFVIDHLHGFWTIFCQISWNILKLASFSVRKQLVSIFRATAHALYLTDLFR